MLEILALVNAVAGLEGVVKAGSELVTGIRGRMGGGDREKKVAAQAELEKLRVGLESVTLLADAATSYVELRDDVQRLAFDCEMMDRFVRTNLGALRNDHAPGYSQSWATVSQMMNLIDRDRTACRKTQSNRQAWFDQKDAGEIATRLQLVDTAYDKCVAYVDTRSADEVAESVAQMKPPLTYADDLLRITLYDAILPGLRLKG